METLLFSQDKIGLSSETDLRPFPAWGFQVETLKTNWTAAPWAFLSLCTVLWLLDSFLPLRGARGCAVKVYKDSQPSRQWS